MVGEYPLLAYPLATSAHTSKSPLCPPNTDAGASIVALRMGAAGSLVGSATGGAVYHHVPAYQPVQEVDPTGCGNAYVGGMMASLLRGDTLVDAAAWGAAAASCMLEARGVPAQAPRLLHEVARRRQAWVREHVG